jgi:hypothetical protein
MLVPRVAWQRTGTVAASAVVQTAAGPALLVAKKSGSSVELLDARTGRVRWSVPPPKKLRVEHVAAVQQEERPVLLLEAVDPNPDVYPHTVARLDEQDGHLRFAVEAFGVGLADRWALRLGDQGGSQARDAETGAPLGPFFSAHVLRVYSRDPSTGRRMPHTTETAPTAAILATTGGVALVARELDEKPSAAHPIRDLPPPSTEPPLLSVYGPSEKPLWQERALHRNVVIVAAKDGVVTWLASSFNHAQDRVEQAVLDTVELSTGKRRRRVELGAVPCPHGRRTVNVPFGGGPAHPKAMLVNLCDQTLFVDVESGEIFARHTLSETPVVRTQDGPVYAGEPYLARWFSPDGQPGASIQLPDRPITLAPAGDRLVVEAGGGTRLVVLDEKGAEVWSQAGEQARLYAWNGVVVGTVDDHVFGFASNGRMLRLPRSARVLGPVLGTRLWVVSTPAGEVRALDLGAP